MTACVRGPGDGAACPVPGIGRANSVDVALLSLLEQQGDLRAIDLARWRPSGAPSPLLSPPGRYSPGPGVPAVPRSGPRLAP